MNKLNITFSRICSAFFCIFAPTTIVADVSLAFLPAEYQSAPANQVLLGQMLFYDAILSGNKNISCATCHHPKFGTSDGVSLALGEGAVLLGPDRHVTAENQPEQRIGRNAPALFNLGAAEFTALFHDGRIEVDTTRAGGFRTPMGDKMASGFQNMLSGQAMFPVLSQDEMAGHYSENDVSKAVRLGFLARQGGAWDIIAARVASIPQYREMFDDVIGEREIRFTDISNVIADFMAVEWRADSSPFDKYLSGETLSATAMAGLALFYGDAGCTTCHAGRFQTDHDFHAIAMPQFGPGKAARFEGHTRDIGRMRVTGNPDDAYKFRTPSLRNVTLTGPYGHDGAYATLEAVVRHHLDPVHALQNYDRSQVVLPNLSGALDWSIMDTPSEVMAIATANQLEPIQLSDANVADILAFLKALTDIENANGRLGVPTTVPSGLPVE